MANRPTQPSLSSLSNPQSQPTARPRNRQADGDEWPVAGVWPSPCMSSEEAWAAAASAGPGGPLVLVGSGSCHAMGADGRVGAQWWRSEAATLRSQGASQAVPSVVNHTESQVGEAMDATSARLARGEERDSSGGCTVPKAESQW